MLDLISIGDIKLDTFVVLQKASLQCSLKLPECLLCLEYGKKIPVEAIDSQIAGSAPNVAVGISRMGRRAAVVSVMGNDGTHTLALQRMKEEKVDAQYIHVAKGKRSSFSVVMNYKGDKTILAAHEPYEYALPKLAPTKWVYVSELGTGYVALYKALIKYVRADHVHLGMNPGAVQIEERKSVLYELMKRTTLLFLNVEEARTLTRLPGSATIPQIVTAAWRLNRKIAVVTNGKQGAYGCDGKKMWFVPIFPGKFVEATGAGDSFATGVLGATMAGLPLTTALCWGAVNSASVIGAVGPQKGLLSATEIKKRLKAHPSFKIKEI